MRSFAANPIPVFRFIDPPPTVLNLLVSITAIVLALGTVEGLAYWWMRPAPAGQGEPVLVYRPGSGARETGISDREAADPNPSSNQKSKINNPQSSISPSSIQNSISPSPALTPLPEIYAASAPMLRCSGGQVLHARIDDSSGIHLAFFEWDGTDTGSVLEAFRHMPEACMGSIGLKLVEKAPSRFYTVRKKGSGIVDRGSEIKLQEQAAAQSSSSNQKSAINNHQSSISPSSPSPQSPIPDHSLVFDHTIFREGGGHTGLGPPIHAFRAVWVAGVPAADARKGLGGKEFDRLRTIRLKSAMDRFRPAHARVIQGAVRGIADPDLAWQAFESAMLKDLSFQ